MIKTPCCSCHAHTPSQSIRFCLSLTCFHKPFVPHPYMSYNIPEMCKISSIESPIHGSGFWCCHLSAFKCNQGFQVKTLLVLDLLPHALCSPPLCVTLHPKMYQVSSVQSLVHCSESWCCQLSAFKCN
jgi:hypothetical protein